MEQMDQKSTFITVLSWILIIFSGFGLLTAIMQNIMVFTMFNNDQFKNVPDSVPRFANFIFANFNIYILFMGILILISFISAIGLLKRKEWARKTYIGLFGIGILYAIYMAIYLWFFNKKANESFDSSFDEFNVSPLPSRS